MRDSDTEVVGRKRRRRQLVRHENTCSLHVSLKCGLPTTVSRKKLEKMGSSFFLFVEKWLFGFTLLWRERVGNPYFVGPNKGLALSSSLPRPQPVTYLIDMPWKGIIPNTSFKPHNTVKKKNMREIDLFSPSILAKKTLSPHSLDIIAPNQSRPRAKSDRLNCTLEREKKRTLPRLEY